MPYTNKLLADTDFNIEDCITAAVQGKYDYVGFAGRENGSCYGGEDL